MAAEDTHRKGHQRMPRPAANRCRLGSGIASFPEGMKIPDHPHEHGAEDQDLRPRRGRHACRHRPLRGWRWQKGSSVVVVVATVVVVLGRTVVVVEPGVVVVVVPPPGGVTVSVKVPLLPPKPSTMMKYGTPAVTVGVTREASDGVH